MAKTQRAPALLINKYGTETLQQRVNGTVLPDLRQLRQAGKLYGPGETEAIRSSADVDFILVANRRNPKSTKTNVKIKKSLWFRLGNALSRIFGPKEFAQDISDDDFEKARQTYLQKLKTEYFVSIVQIDLDSDFRDQVDGQVTDDDGMITSFYLIKGSFCHFGLMAQLMSYQWPLNNEELAAKLRNETSASTTKSLPIQSQADTRIVSINSPTASQLRDADIFKSFYFFKHGRERFLEYKQCRQRSDFDQAHRFDLIYHFLVGATVYMTRFLNPWRNITDRRLIEINRQQKASQEKPCGLMQLLADEVFDDWLIMHEPLQEHHKPADNQSGCCSNCCYPCISCRCCGGPDGTSLELSKGFSFAACSIWRNFWYRNCIESVNVQKQSGENDRSYLLRVSTLRNALTFKRFGGATDDESSLVKILHIMPLFELRRYFGEKIGFYFAWLELFTLSLTIPAGIGALFFIAALIYYAVTLIVFPDGDTEFLTSNVTMQSVLFDTSLATTILAKSCDNYATPAFAAIMLVWGTAFGEWWHRRSCWYQYLWRVDNVEATEFERPKGSRLSFVKRLLRSKYGGRYLLFLPSFFVTLLFCCAVFASVYFVNVINIFAFPYCIKNEANGTETRAAPTTTTTTSDYAQINQSAVIIAAGTSSDKTNEDMLICSSFDAVRVIINAISIMLLDFLYQNVVYLLTDLECHATQTQFNDALILKLFVFKFVNSYAVLFFVAFGVAPQLIDYPREIVGDLTPPQRVILYGCNGNSNCMALLTKQLLGCILTKPLIKSITDVLMPRVIFFLRMICTPKEIRQAGMDRFSFTRANVIKTPALKRRVSRINQIHPSLEADEPPPTEEPSQSGTIKQLPQTPVLTKRSTLPPIKSDIGIVTSEPPPTLYPQIPPQSSDQKLAPEIDDRALLEKLAIDMERQHQMPKLSTLDREEFTQIEYMDRAIMYGALLMFSVALPPAPLLALLIMRIDCFLDIGRMVADYRRPLPFRVQDIGIWEKIITFLTYCGILTNPLVCILTSTWGSRLTMIQQFWTFLLFEHGMFLIRMLSTALINEIPPDLAKAKLLTKRYKDELMSSLTAKQQRQQQQHGGGETSETGHSYRKRNNKRANNLSEDQTTTSHHLGDDNAAAIYSHQSTAVTHAGLFGTQHSQTSQ